MNHTELHSGWAPATIGDIAEQSVEQSKPVGVGQFLYVDISSIDRGTKRVTDAKVLPIDGAPSRARQRLKPSDVLISMTRPNLNAVTMLPEAMSGAIASTGFFVLRSSYVHSSWLFYLVQTTNFIESMSALVLGVLYPAVRPKDIAAYSFALPPREEQQRVVAEIEKQFTRLDAAVAALKRVQANLKRYRAAVLKAACEGRLVPTEAELARKEGRSYETGEQLLARILKERRAKWAADQLAKMQGPGKAPRKEDRKGKYKEPALTNISLPESLPEGWVWVTSDCLFTFVTSGSRGWANYYSDKGALFVRIGNLDHDSIDLDLRETQRVVPPAGTEGERTKIQHGDILVSITADVGMIARVPELRETTYINQHIGLCRPVASVDGRYLAWYLTSGNGQKQFKNLQRGATKTGLGLDDLRSVMVPLPPLAEQARIVEALQTQLTAVPRCGEDCMHSIKRADRLRQSILRHAFEGKLVPQDPSDEPASVLLERIRAERAAIQKSNKQPRKQKAKVAAVEAS